MRGPKRREGGGLHVGRAWGELLHMKSAFGMGREGFSNLGRIRWLTMGVAMKISNICRHHIWTSSNNPIRQTDGKADGDRPPAERNGDPPPGGPFNPFCSGRGRGKAREREGGEASQLHKAPPSKAPPLALPYFSVGRRRRPLGSGRISVRNLDLTLWKAFIAAPLHKSQRERDSQNMGPSKSL